MALIGAITRLTESGLSITDWNPIMGAIPPLSEAAWQKAFEAYQKIPQYQILHRDMTLAAFKDIFFWEWVHRLWGRIIGVFFAIPLIFFLVRRAIDRKLALRLLAILALGALQGFVGWYMVKSGLEVRTSVSPYRLALHLGFALFIYALMLHTALRLWTIPRLAIERKYIKMGYFSLACLIVTMVWGALVAGLHGGEAYNTWPLMDERLLPTAAFTLLPKWLNFFENLALVQFIHRWLAPFTAILILFWAHSLRQSNAKTLWPNLLAMMAVVQIALGLSTLLTHVNIILAASHQAGAISLLTLVLINLWRLKPLSEPLP